MTDINDQAGGWKLSSDVEESNIQWVEKRDWKEFKDSGLLWFINRILHVFGWAVVMNIDIETGEELEAYPARCHYRGFSPDAETEGFKKLYNWLDDNLSDFEKDIDL